MVSIKVNKNSQINNWENLILLVCQFYLYSVKHEEFFDNPFGYTIPLNNPFSWLGGGSFIVMSIDPDRHCIRTVGSIIDACDVAKLKMKERKTQLK